MTVTRVKAGTPPVGWPRSAPSAGLSSKRRPRCAGGAGRTLRRADLQRTSPCKACYPTGFDWESGVSSELGTRVVPHVRLDGNMSDHVPARVASRFGSTTARPKLVRIYLHTTGWQKLERPEVLTWDVVESLRSRGVTRIDLAWHFRHREMSLQRVGSSTELSTAS